MAHGTQNLNEESQSFSKLLSVLPSIEKMQNNYIKQNNCCQHWLFLEVIKRNVALDWLTLLPLRDRSWLEILALRSAILNLP
jgi:hypothetical protein